MYTSLTMNSLPKVSSGGRAHWPCGRVMLYLAVLTIWILPAPGRADDARVEQARQLYHKGEEQYRIGQFAQALQHYEAALKLSPRPNLMFNIAQCFRLLKQPARALFYYKLYITEWNRRHSGDPEPFVFRDARRHIVQLTSKIKAREAKNQAKEAEARWKERLRREEQWRKEQLALLKELFKWKQRDHDRRLADIKETLKRLEERGRKRPGQLNLTGLNVKGAKVELDGSTVAMSPVIHPLKIKSGDHKIRVTAAGYHPWSAQVKITPGESVNLLIQLRRVPTRKKVWLVLSLTTLALAAGAEATAIVFAQNANEHYQGTDAFAQDQLISNTGHISAGILGAAAVTTFVLYLLSHRWGNDAPPSAAQVPGNNGTATAGGFTF